MKQWVGYVLLALSLVVAYQGWANVAKVAETEPLARSVACEVGQKECAITKDGLGGHKADVLARHYQWPTTLGPVHVTCRRAWVFFGQWSCTSALGEM